MGVARRAWSGRSTTPPARADGRFRVVHPFHPLTGEQFELVGYAHTWGEHRVYFRRPGDDHVRTLPASWTDVVDPDPFVVVARKRCLARVEDLLALAALISEIRTRTCQ